MLFVGFERSKELDFLFYKVCAVFAVKGKKECVSLLATEYCECYDLQKIFSV